MLRVAPTHMGFDVNLKEPLDVRAWRKGERARLLEARRTMAIGAYNSACEAVLEVLATHLPPASQPLIGCYWPFRREFNCLPYMRMVIGNGGRVALPVVVGRGRPLEFRSWTEDARMEAGVWNIPHPASGPPVTPSALVIPLLGFDEAGFRLGYGAGYYDTTIASFVKRPCAVGVGFELSRLPTIFPQSHDRPMDVIITETGVRKWSRTGDDAPEARAGLKRQSGKGDDIGSR